MSRRFAIKRKRAQPAHDDGSFVSLRGAECVEVIAAKIHMHAELERFLRARMLALLPFTSS